jgi:uncharacterized protein YbbC (DUF1343 family)
MKVLIPSCIVILIYLCIFCNPLHAQTIKTGLEVLMDDDFAALKGKKVGLITNPTGVDHQLNSTIDILYHASGIKLVALFGPEHGVRGDYPAGENIDKYTDPKTGLLVYSIYGSVYLSMFSPAG